jgi:hypothetical protein
MQWLDNCITLYHFVTIYFYLETKYVAAEENLGLHSFPMVNPGHNNKMMRRAPSCGVGTWQYNRRNNMMLSFIRCQPYFQPYFQPYARQAASRPLAPPLRF